MTESLNLLKNIYDAQPGLFALQLITDAKRDEFVNIYSDEQGSANGEDQCCEYPERN